MLKTRAIGSRQSSRTASLPCAAGGWNARDPISEMPLDDAIKLENLIPTPTEVVSRKGFVKWATGLGGPVESVFVFNPSSGSSVLFGAAAGNIFDCTTQGAVGAAVVSGLTSNHWQTVNFSTSAGNFLIAVNGSDKLLLFDGSTWKAIDGTSTPAITGVATTALTGVNIYAQRLWFVEVEKLKVWYLPVGSIGGAAASIDLGNAFRLGGYLQAIGTITLDAGAGSDDHIAFVSSRGEVAIYHGTDPSSPNTWARIGVYRIGTPMGRRCLENFEGDLLVLSLEGLGLLSQLVISSQVNTRENYLTDKIKAAISAATTAEKSTYGWDIQVFPRDNLLWINVPFLSGSQQYVMNTITSSWCNFKNFNALNWTIFNDNPFFASRDGFVGEALSGETDDGDPIEIAVTTSFFDFKNNSQLKQFLLARIILVANQLEITNSLSISTEVNYYVGSHKNRYNFKGYQNVSKWGEAVWGTAKWGRINVPLSNWINIQGIGYSMALNLEGYLRHSFAWRSTDVTYQFGGII